jgi:hypothetical protein
MEHASSPGMMLELVSEVSGRKYLLLPNSLGKVLNLARLEGWQPEQEPNECPSDAFDTAIVLPHFGSYLPGRFSRVDAKGLKTVLTRALATGTVAADGTDQAAASTLLQLAREGAFRVRIGRLESSTEPQTLAGVFSA